MAQHTIVVEVADEATNGRRQRSAADIEAGLTQHIERWGSWPTTVLEYHRERMTEPADEYETDAEYRARVAGDLDAPAIPTDKE